MRKLTAQEIDELAGRSGVNRRVAEAWLANMYERIDPLQALVFLRYKAGEGGYNRATLEAIGLGIGLVVQGRWEEK